MRSLPVPYSRLWDKAMECSLSASAYLLWSLRVTVDCDDVQGTWSAAYSLAAWQALQVKSAEKSLNIEDGNHGYQA